MATYFAKIENNVVVDVIAASQEFIDSGIVGHGWELTDYNTRGGVHYGPDGQPDGKPQFGYNYAGIGFGFQKEPYAFFPPQPYQSWTLDPQTYLWVPPIPYPNDGGYYMWDEKDQEWIPENVAKPKKTK